ncbi:hypothetical protein O6H91_19G040000 [Diphasiastrum complanatum]|uniref:Uncharacterized protein n=1 Tax=Diphasiastrum complanatum TaxID=34168 RepID=A0ACC2AUT1_DIPCM|nr:hypothetical protein O6H91_19G040000 [Diphasiastrum complanatum]
MLHMQANLSFYICDQGTPASTIFKALGDYTRLIGDFSLLPQLIENKNSEQKLWYETNVEAYFDDEEEFKRIKAMCKLYCTLCEQSSVSEDVSKGVVKKGHTFKTLDLLRRHLFGVHKSVMCNLCLEGRKVFICEQKLYTKAQLERHSSDGTSKVDGNEEERGGFGGHPICDFCRRRFYGDNELYHHMSTEHYTCHICQRSRPGQFEYYRNYDDLEAHFRHEHVLCEHPDCLAKKFVVFPSEAELKRHNATTHGGSMSRAQRNAALQIPVSFQFRRSGQDAREDQGSSYRRGRRSRGQDRDANQSATMMQISTEVANLEEALRLSAVLHSSSGADSNSHILSAEGPSDNFPALRHEGSGTNPINADMETSRYLAAAQGVGPSALGDSAFPPLPGISKSARRRAKQRNQSAALSMAALLGGRKGGGVRVLNTAHLTQSRSSDVPESAFNGGEMSTHHYCGNVATAPIEQEESRVFSGIKSDSRVHVVGAVGGPDLPPGASQGASGGGNQDKASMLLLDQEVENQVFDKLSMDEIKAANKALVDQIRAGLKGDEQLFADFKSVSSRFRKGEMGSDEFHEHIVRLGLTYIVPELARLCPDPQKQDELLKVHRSRMMSDKTLNDVSWPTVASASSSSLEKMKAEVKSKGKRPIHSEESEVPISSSIPSSTMETKVRESISEVVEVLHTDGYRSARGKVKATDGSTLSTVAPNGVEKSLQVLVKAAQESSLTSVSRSLDSDLEESWACGVCTLVNPATNMECIACRSVCPHSRSEKNLAEDGIASRKKKTSKIPKFQRVRLGDGSAAALLDPRQQNPWISGIGESSNGDAVLSGRRSFGRGVWKTQGGQHIRSLAHRDSVIDQAHGSRE